jgi:hypothetical protein
MGVVARLNPWHTRRECSLEWYKNSGTGAAFNSTAQHYTYGAWLPIMTLNTSEKSMTTRTAPVTLRIDSKGERRINE